MDIFPIWKSTFYETETDRVKFRILKWGVQEICRATAVRLPDDELLRIGLNKPCQNYLDSNIDVSATGTTSSNAYAEFSLQVWNESNSQWFNAYEFAFVNDWSYGEREDTGSFSEPINGHAAPGQLIPYSVMSTGLTGETICYDEYDFNAYLSVSPTTIMFNHTGGTATITIFSNTNWTITQYGNLVSLSQTAGTSGTTTISLNCPENTTIVELSDTLKVRADKQGTTATENVHIIQNAVEQNYLYFDILTNDNDLWWNLPDNDPILYSKDDKRTWTPITSGKIPTSIGDRVYFKGTNQKYSCGFNNSGFYGTTKFNIGGNIMSLLYGDNFVINQEFPDVDVYHYFLGLFQKTNVVSAEKLSLPADRLAGSCYQSMFEDCVLLEKAPKLPATDLAVDCYGSMFKGCVSLETAPFLPPAFLEDYCYQYMFQDCTSLINAPGSINATGFDIAACLSMFEGCVSLEKAPDLLATSFGDNFQCYKRMFYGCSSLNYVKCLLADIPYNHDCTTNWLYGVSPTGTFVKNPSMTGWSTGASGIPSGWTIVNA